MSTLSNLSKIDKWYMHDEINMYFDDNLSKIQCGFLKGCSAHHCLFYIIVKIRIRRYSKKVFATVNVSCCWQKYVLMPFIYAYLSQKKQKNKVGSDLQTLQDKLMGILLGASQFVFSQRSPWVWQLCRSYNSFCLSGKF